MSSPQVLTLRALRKTNFLRTENMKKKLYVYRIENDEGEGPFKNNVMTFKTVTREVFSKKRQNRKILYLRPDQDFDYVQLTTFYKYMRIFNAPFKFGFINIRQIFKWFNNEELAELKKRGYKIKRKRADVVIYSDNQCMFITGSGE